MKIEEQVCTLEQAKRLKELGVKQDSVATYYTISISKEPVLLYTAQPSDESSFSAFTVAELGEKLPKMTETFRTLSGRYCCNGSGVNNKSFYRETEAQARAAMLIYLLETKTIEP